MQNNMDSENTTAMLMDWLSECAQLVQLTRDELMHSTSRKTAEYRELTWLVMKENGYTLKTIADFFSRKNHTTIVSGLRYINGLLGYDEALQETLSDFKYKYDTFFTYK